MAPFRGLSVGRVVRGTRPTERLFGYDVTLDRTGVRCQASSGGMSSRSVSPWLSRADRLPRPRRDLVGVGRHAPRPPVQRVARVALERRRQARRRGAAPGSRPVRRTAAGARRPPRPPGAAAARSARTAPSCSRSPRFEAVTPSSRTRMPADLGPRQLERGAVDRLGQVGRLGQRPLAGDRAEAAVADLDRDRAGPDAGRAQPAGDAVGHREQRPLDDLGVARVDVEGVLVADRLGRVAVVDRVGVEPARPVDERRRRACRTGGRGGPAAAPRGRRSSGPDTRPAPTAVFSPTPHSRPIGSGARNAASSPGGTTTSPSGLRRSDAILATSLVRRDADRRGQPDLVADRRP